MSLHAPIHVTGTANCYFQWFRHFYRYFTPFFNKNKDFNAKQADAVSFDVYMEAILNFCDNRLNLFEISIHCDIFLFVYIFLLLFFSFYLFFLFGYIVAAPSSLCLSNEC